VGVGRDVSSGGGRVEGAAKDPKVNILSSTKIFMCSEMSV